MSPKVLILGGSGMLGTAVVSRLKGEDLEVTATARDVSRFASTSVKWHPLSADGTELLALTRDFGEGDFVINCIGLIKHHIDDLRMSSRQQAVLINALFPYSLAELAEEQGFRVVQIATDCVFAGRQGAYSEAASHDAEDVYGKSKSLGEVPSANMLNLRCSIVGQEPAGGPSLIGWLLSQERGAQISGYTDHNWNGVTTTAFADVVAGLISSRSSLAGTYHLVPSDAMNKSDLSALILEVFGRTDVHVAATVTGRAIDRTLSTNHPEVNQRLWKLGGYSLPPTIDAMVRALTLQST